MPEGCFNSLHADGCPWNFAYLWNSMDWLSRADVCLLALMLANVLFIACDRLYRYHRAQRRSRIFLREAAGPLREGKLRQLLSLTAENKKSHIANVIRSGLIAFAFAPADLTNSEALDVAQHALQRTRATLILELKHGLGTLSTIASSAPFIGLLGTVYGILDSFRGIGHSKASGLPMVASALANSLVTAAAGLVVAIPAVWWRNHLRIRVEVFDTEMSNAESETTTYLQVHPEWRKEREASSQGMITALPANAPRFCEVPYNRQRALFLGTGLCALYFTYALAFAVYLHFVAF